MLTVDPTPQADLPFLENKHNVRISVSGLAFCKLDRDDSVIHFLRHIQFHELEMEVVQRAVGTPKGACIGKFYIELDHDIIVRPNIRVRPESIAFNVGTYADNDLSRIVNFSHKDVHDEILGTKNPFPNINRPTTLAISNCAFYTGNSTKDEYELVEILPPPPPEAEESEPRSAHFGRVGLELGGAIICPPPGAGEKETITEVIVEGYRPFNLTLPHRIGGVDFIYEITFNNHCIQPPALCENAAGTDSDFRFYYDVLQDDLIKGRTFRMKQKTYLLGVKPAVCNITRNGA